MASDGAAPAALRPVGRLLRPGSIAIVGISPTKGSVGAGVLANLERFNYAGEIHLVSRTSRAIGPRACVPAIDDLPMGIDVAVLGLPRAAVVDAVAACARRGVGAVMIFASGFAETGPEGQALQARIADLAQANGMLVAGPNCVGFTNFIDRVPLTFAPAILPDANSGSAYQGRALAIVAQSGGMMANLRSSCLARGVPVAYAISTGNEAGLGIEDYLAELIADRGTAVIGMFVEHIRRPALFLELAARARHAGKPIVLLHPGRSEMAREAALSHTGALAADHDVMRALVGREAVVMVDTMEELVDVSQILTRFAARPTKGAAIVTDSGAFKGFALDFAETVGLPLPALAPATNAALAGVLPEFAAASNPLDITAQGLLNPPLYGDSARALLADPATDSLIVSILPGSPQIGLAIGRTLLPALTASRKPVAYAVMGGETKLADELVADIRASGVPFFRSPERALRALAHITRYGRVLAASAPPGAVEMAVVAPPARGALAEYEGKNWLAGLGIPVPEGELARSEAEAVAVAARLGAPVVLKAQSRDLPHKSDAGGVLAGLDGAAAIRDGWSRLYASVARARPGLVLDGVLVEKMAAPGLELVVGARRVPGWGPVLMVGLGGVWIEMLKDVRLLPVDLDAPRIAAELLALKAAPLLQGARGAPPADIAAAAQIIARVGAVMRAVPDLLEIEINPLRVYAKGRGAVALDALVVRA